MRISISQGSIFFFLFFQMTCGYSCKISQNELQKWFKLSKTDTLLEHILLLEPIVEGFVQTDFWSSSNWKRQEVDYQFRSNRDVILSEASFNSFSSLLKKKPSIPSCFHFIWLGSPLSDRTKSIIGSWAKHHPNWEVNVWTDEDVAHFAWSSMQMKKIFQKVRTWAEKSDILRYEILNHFGGVYADTDFICLKSIDSIVGSNIEFFAGIPQNVFWNGNVFIINNALIGTVPNHPIIQHCIDQLIEFDLNNQLLVPYHNETNTLFSPKSGPCTFSKACCVFLENKMENICIFPCSYFYPLPIMNRSEIPESIVPFLKPESFAVHLWDASWLSEIKNYKF